LLLKNVAAYSAPGHVIQQNATVSIGASLPDAWALTSVHNETFGRFTMRKKRPTAGELTEPRAIGRLLGRPIASEEDIYKLCSAGISIQSYQIAVAMLRLTDDDIFSAHVIRSRLRGQRPLSTAMSEQLIRILRLFNQARDLFGRDDAALEWLKSPNSYVEDYPAVSALELARTDVGSRIVEQLLRRTAHGMLY
jgi:putative toxin-antitoxin system antitoxin component (TIGR02293 family)